MSLSIEQRVSLLEGAMKRVQSFMRRVPLERLESDSKATSPIQGTPPLGSISNRPLVEVTHPGPQAGKPVELYDGKLAPWLIARVKRSRSKKGKDRSELFLVFPADKISQRGDWVTVKCFDPDPTEAGKLADAINGFEVRA